MCVQLESGRWIAGERGGSKLHKGQEKRGGEDCKGWGAATFTTVQIPMPMISADWKSLYKNAR